LGNVTGMLDNLGETVARQLAPREHGREAAQQAQPGTRVGTPIN
jgi:hypothetical protein